MQSLKGGKRLRYNSWGSLNSQGSKNSRGEKLGDKCAGKEDPYSLDSIPKEFAIRLEENGFHYCFDIRYLQEAQYRAYKSRTEFIHPMLRRPFSEENLEKIERKIIKVKRVPLAIKKALIYYVNSSNILREFDDRNTKTDINYVQLYKSYLYPNHMMTNNDYTINGEECKLNFSLQINLNSCTLVIETVNEEIYKELDEFLTSILENVFQEPTIESRVKSWYR